MHLMIPIKGTHVRCIAITTWKSSENYRRVATLYKNWTTLHHRIQLFEMHLLCFVAIVIQVACAYGSTNITSAVIEDRRNEQFEEEVLLPASPSLQTSVLDLHRRVAESAIRYLHGDMVVTSTHYQGVYSYALVCCPSSNSLEDHLQQLRRGSW